MTWDARKAREALTCPMLALASLDDVIVPPSMSEAIWDGKHHLVARRRPCAALEAPAIGARAMSLNSPMLSRHSADIAARFGERAASYELNAGLQRAVADRLAPPLA